MTRKRAFSEVISVIALANSRSSIRFEPLPLDDLLRGQA